jgi:hypothetical protein
MKRLIIINICSLFLTTPFLFGQNFQVEYSTEYIYDSNVSGVEYVRFQIETSGGTYEINGDGLVIVEGVPTKIIIKSYILNVDEYGNQISRCGPKEETIVLPNDECANVVNNAFNTFCAGYVYVILNSRPVLSYNQGTTPSDSKVCITDPVRLVASPGFSSYTWRARTSSGNKYFDPGPGNDVSFTLADVYGNSATNFINESVFFEYLVGNCTDFSIADVVDYKFSVPPPEIEQYNIQMPMCNGSENGSISNVQLSRDLLTAKNEEVSFYLASESGDDPGNSDDGNYFNLKAGNYTLSLQSDQFDYCTEDIPTENITISEPDALAFTVSNHIPVSCYGSATGSITIEPSGGQGSIYEYSIDNSSFDNNPIITGLNAGDHSLTVRDGNNCTFTDQISIAGPSNLLDATIAITSDYNGSSLSCPLSVDGSILLSASGGWGNYLYSTDENGTYSNDNEFHDLSKGEHTFWIMDDSGCKSSATVLIEPPLSIDATTVLIQPNCPGNFGSITINATGGSGTKEFSLDDSSYQQSNTFELFAGVYSIYIRDQNSCKSVLQDLLLTDPQPIEFNSTVTNPTCQSSEDGALDITNVLHGQSPYMYSIDGGSTYSNTSSFYNLAAGSYNIVIKDSQNCTVSNIVELKDPSPIIGDFTVFEISCYGEADGSLAIIPQGGEADYSYLWSTGSTANKIENLETGEYSVLIFDSNGCQSEELFYTLSEPSDIYVELLTSNYNGPNVSCLGKDDGFAEVLVSGGTILSDYQYLWSNGTTERLNEGLSQGEYTVTVIDDNGCMVKEDFEIVAPQPIEFSSLEVLSTSCYNGQDGAIDVFVEGGVGDYRLFLNDGAPLLATRFEGLSAGLHKIEVVDDNGCSQDTTIQINQPQEIIVNASEINSTTCGQSNGSIEVEIIGGTGDYIISWKNENEDTIGQSLLLDSLESGQYSISIIDQNGCNLERSFSISNSDGPNIEIDSIVGISCSSTNDGSAAILVTGGSPPYFIKWDNGAEDLIATNLASGEHEVSVEDANGCKTFIKVNIPNISPVEISILEVQGPSCFGNSDGRIHLEATGGAPPYIFNWDHDEIVGNDIQNLEAATYKVSIIDSNSCIKEFEISVDEPQPLVVEQRVINPTCKNANDGEIYITATGGTPPYNILYGAEPVTAGVLRNISSGTYVFEIQDNQGCQSEMEVIVDDIEQAPIEFEDLVICSEQEITINSPIPGSEYLWSHNNEFLSSESLINLNEAGIYTLHVTSSSGCIFRGEFVVTTSNDVLKTEFLASSNANVGDTIIVIDITYPVPDSVNWIVPAEAEVINSNNYYAILVFKTPGIHTVGLESFLGLCYDLESTQINIHSLPEGNVSGRIFDNSTQLIESNVYPNPNNGKFKVHALLNRNDVIEITIIDLISKKKVFHKSYESVEMTVEYSLTDIKSGPYAIVIQADSQLKVHRIIIQ